MYQLPGITRLRFVLWLVLGLILYVLYGYRNSALRRAAEGASAAEPPERVANG
jgi:APA family basic amino acid/polyamine antiporter